jgi:hypothetical protein
VQALEKNICKTPYAGAIGIFIGTDEWEVDYQK